jgi:hypothetical protein
LVRRGVDVRRIRPQRSKEDRPRAWRTRISTDAFQHFVTKSGRGLKKHLTQKPNLFADHGICAVSYFMGRFNQNEIKTATLREFAPTSDPN